MNIEDYGLWFLPGYHYMYQGQIGWYQDLYSAINSSDKLRGFVQIIWHGENKNIITFQKLQGYLYLTIGMKAWEEFPPQLKANLSTCLPNLAQHSNGLKARKKL